MSVYVLTYTCVCMFCVLRVQGVGTRVNMPHMDICEYRFVHNVPIAEPCEC